MPTQRITVFLLRKGITSFTDAIDKEKSFETIDTDSDSGVDGRFYYQNPKEKTPTWVGFINPILQKNLPKISTATASALLLLKVNARIFALTFGYGRSLLDLTKIEHQFGLRVAINSINPDQIRSLDTKSYEDLVVSTTTQTSKSTELPTFNVDISSDILRAVTGEPRDDSFASRVAGSDSLVLNTSLTPHELNNLCQKLLDLYEEDTYKENFGWIDQLSVIQDPATIEKLDKKLVTSLRNGDVSTTHLAMPENIDWKDISGFQITGTRKHIFDELDLEDYLSRLKDRKDLDLGLLKNRYISVKYSRSGGKDKRWSLYQCLVSEQRVDKNLYVLIENQWFAVADSLVEEVDNFVESLPTPNVDLPSANSGETEPDYNNRITKDSLGNLLKLDAKIKRPGGASSGIEFCDALTKDGELIHIKRKARSSTLSHLFAQGSVSAMTFMSDGYYRDEIRKMVSNSVENEKAGDWLQLIPDSESTVDRERYTVAYAVITNTPKRVTNSQTNKRNDWLPFFSKLNLMQQGKQLRTMGFQLALARIPVV
ncbi:DUF6119 family protein [Corynebacterium aurimucosum]